ncbi:hypothetical protein HAX54_030537 [Datura stramonium]|uniref:Receptor-like serine/threonine-protein kinase n=1 Tax=Datura stramonium TaxID=4076 RepID=A0ABS8VAV9_DATST|nr:hypothetical protein [Datura stramonium]
MILWWCHLLLILFYLCLLCSSANIIRPGEIFKDGDNITSPQGKFILGFFSPIKISNQRFLGIWYADDPMKSVVWVANRNKPVVSEEKGVFTIEKDGNLVVKDGHGHLLWSTNISGATTNSTAFLRDSGNLVISNSSGMLWESFQYPTDTYLPDMRLYLDPKSGEHRFLTCWKSESDPSPGRYSFGIDTRGSPQIVIWDGSNRRWRSGYWDGLLLKGIPNIKEVNLDSFMIYKERDRWYFAVAYTSVNVRLQMNWNGTEVQYRWDKDKGQWSPIQYLPSGGCDLYNSCGNFTICDISSSRMCLCLEGFVPKDLEQWKARNWTGGCVRKTELECQRNTSTDEFLVVERIKLPDFADTVDAQKIDHCRNMCLANCSCTAYAFVNGKICMIWSAELVDVQQFKEGGNSLYVRTAHSEIGNRNRTINFVLISTLVVGAIVVSLSVWLLYKHRAKRGVSKRITEGNPIRAGECSMDLTGPGDVSVDGHTGSGSELIFFSFSSVAAATDNFSEANKLGQGGFGPVYKGKLPKGQEIAVKRLSRKSGQGVEEFKNEIMLIAKLQHRNLVRLLGCCMEGEKMLLYEYMPNKSLDFFLFDPARQAQLNWRKRFNIIAGIARGLLYLHRDSRLRIVHRDLKAGNVLLDEEMNPKISDFGMARIFGGNQNEANTNRIVGTYGYMAPEYAMKGLFSVKSDVYSFGVLLLEIISGKRNTQFRSEEHFGIIGYAWEKWDRGMPMDLVDHAIWDECQHDEALRCIHLALLCVQNLAENRPDMSSVMKILETSNIKLPLPSEPNYTLMSRHDDADIPSANYVTMSVIVGR